MAVYIEVTLCIRLMGISGKKNTGDVINCLFVASIHIFTEINILQTRGQANASTDLYTKHNLRLTKFTRSALTSLFTRTDKGLDPEK